MKKTHQGFTRIEVIFCIAGLALLLVPALSLLASNKTEAQRVICSNNLRQIGRGFLTWANDHNDSFPWTLSAADGGLYGHPLDKFLWFQFGYISNQLGSPKILVCPADQATPKIADHWGLGEGGLYQASYQGNAVSYLLALHARPFSQNSLLSGDYNFTPTQRNTVCSYLTGLPFANQLSAHDPNIHWTNSIHGASGNLLFGDGSVRFSSSSDLLSIVRQSNDENDAGIHYLVR